MYINEIITLGMKNEASHLVGEEHTAIHIGSGGSKVLATPWMIAFMERVSHGLLAQHLPEGYSSVGVLVHVRHLAPTPVGNTVRVACEVIDIDGVRVTFKVQAWDDTELVGEGEHQRYVIDEARFLKRVTGKGHKDALQKAQPG
jgi:predicted thioesterase